jgi:hypothetical protein
LVNTEPFSQSNRNLFNDIDIETKTEADLNSVRRGWAMGCLRPKMSSSLETLAATPLGGVKSKIYITEKQRLYLPTTGWIV